jgi:The GLUG motif
MKRMFASKRKHCLTGVSVFLLVAALFAGTAGCNYAPPTSEDLEVRTWYDLDAVRNNLAGHHVLMNDLDSTTLGYDELAGPTAKNGEGWEPIGSEDPNPPYELHMFAGSFDGQGYKICDLFINRTDQHLVGLFGLLDEGAVIENVGLVNAAVTGRGMVGSLVGHSQGVVINCYATGNVAGGMHTGGLVGDIMQGSMTNVYSTSSVTGLSGVGGLAGSVDYSTITNSYSTGSVTGNYSVGGLVGTGSFSTVTNSYSTGSVTGNHSVGGLVGVASADLTVSNSLWDAQTSGQNISAGGTGLNTTAMQDIATFSGAEWDITAVADPSARSPSYIWNIVNGVTYPFLSWQPV